MDSFSSFPPLPSCRLRLGLGHSPLPFFPLSLVPVSHLSFSAAAVAVTPGTTSSGLPSTPSPLSTVSPLPPDALPVGNTVPPPPTTPPPLPPPPASSSASAAETAAQVINGWNALCAYEARTNVRPSYSWWPGQDSGAAYHTNTRLPGNREGLLADSGAYENIMGDRWLKRVTSHAEHAGKKTKVETQSGLGSVCGVGGSSNAVRSKATVPVGVKELGNTSYTGSVLDDSDVPALLGLKKY